MLLQHRETEHVLHGNETDERAVVLDENDTWAKDKVVSTGFDLDLWHAHAPHALEQLHRDLERELRGYGKRRLVHPRPELEHVLHCRVLHDVHGYLLIQANCGTSSSPTEICVFEVLRVWRKGNRRIWTDVLQATRFLCVNCSV